MELSCHCGNVKITVAHSPEALTSCNCSTCNRYGSLWGYYTPNQVQLSFITDIAGTSVPATKAYRWGEEYIEFHHCQSCGCLTHYVTTDKVPDAKYGINFRMAPITKMKDIKVRHFDGADSWKYLD
ncbi:hypothetical protein Sps_05244 [Shewanella psychrophila]|uniref:CENP-V/GFA domain-containing protein n=1 Tax=Shewanella psychrophila TaxID=225848 RepID=A0A1S6HXP8_9GAMM|nr:aldehyde-activating protein [Shewanella psychrophila]AQS40313.1 hypothetical protein Sps_05244 [Shewanella psychrophila]